MQSNLTIAVIATAFALSAHADIVTVNLGSPTLAGLPGDTLTFQGTLANTSGADQYINGGEVILNSFNSNDFDASDFLLNAPLILTNGSTTSPFDFFTVTIPDPFASGPYSGEFGVFGGSTGSAEDQLGTVDFTVQVGGAPAAGVPEPASFGMLCSGLAALWVVRRCQTNLASPSE